MHAESPELFRRAFDLLIQTNLVCFKLADGPEQVGQGPRFPGLLQLLKSVLTVPYFLRLADVIGAEPEKIRVVNLFIPFQLLRFMDEGIAERGAAAPDEIRYQAAE